MAKQFFTSLKRDIQFKLEILNYCQKSQIRQVISNFRENDILNGGQGAPLAPIYHQLILSRIKSKPPSAFINIGGISNITYMVNLGSIIK